jgi:hypothetical protein
MFYYVFLCSHNIHVMFYDIFSDVLVIYMRCSIMYFVMFYGVFSIVGFSIHVIFYSLF